MKKFEVRWSNGYWKVFDRNRYTSVALCFTRAEAEAKASQMARSK